MFKKKRKKKKEKKKNCVLRTIDEAMSVFNECRIPVNTLSENVLDPSLKKTLTFINDAIEAMCHANPELSMIDSRIAMLKDSIHFASHEIHSIACKVLNSVHYV